MESSRISVKGSRRVILPSRVPPCARYFAFVASLLIILLFLMFRGGENRNSRRRTELAVQVVHSIYIWAAGYYPDRFQQAECDSLVNQGDEV